MLTLVKIMDYRAFSVKVGHGYRPLQDLVNEDHRCRIVGKGGDYRCYDGLTVILQIW